jgi:hypothetical protein
MEFDRDKLPASIDVAEKTIHQRLRGLPIANSKEHRELSDALNSLAVLKGLRFNFHHELHYGWARLSVRAEGSSVKALLTGYAYETIPKEAIRAGQIHGINYTR